MKALHLILSAIFVFIPMTVFAAGLPADLPVGAPGWQPNARVFLFQVPFYHQQQALTCEIATLRMALKGIGVTVAEKELWNRLAKDPTPRTRINGSVVWGDPNIGFVGKPNGRMLATGYGVYAPPIAALANEYAIALQIRVDDPHAIDSALSQGHPIITWFAAGKSTAVTSWKTPSGKVIQTPLFEHTRVIVGYRGTSESIEGLYVIDPLTSIHYVSWNEFVARNAFFDHVGLEIAPR